MSTGLLLYKNDISKNIKIVLAICIDICYYIDKGRYGSTNTVLKLNFSCYMNDKEAL